MTHACEAFLGHFDSTLSSDLPRHSSYLYRFPLIDRGTTGRCSASRIYSRAEHFMLMQLSESLLCWQLHAWRTGSLFACRQGLHCKCVERIKRTLTGSSSQCRSSHAGKTNLPCPGQEEFRLHAARGRFISRSTPKFSNRVCGSCMHACVILVRTPNRSLINAWAYTCLCCNYEFVLCVPAPGAVLVL